MHVKKIIPFLIGLLAIPSLMMGQVTTSSISGSVKQTNGEALAGATITAIHVPSGTKYETMATKTGTFTLPGLRPGGPYTIIINFVGYHSQTIENINLTLGDDYGVNVDLSQSSQTLSEVVITGTRAANLKTGASTNVGQRQITTLPTITRSLTDFTRLTPQANGNSMAGRDGRYNNITVDGANLNNNFGLSTDPLPGGNNQPISLDAIEEISVNIAPADVRQSNFTGANIAAVTKSGTNVFKGSVYGLYRNQNYLGRNVGSNKLPEQPESKSTVYGASVGGPIIKNKLFFFINAEKEERIAPPISSFRPTGGGAGGNTSNVKIDSLKKFSDYLASKYGYSTGSYDGMPTTEVSNYKILGKIDWNINTNHKLTLKYSEMVGNDDRGMSNSVPNGANTGTNNWTTNTRFGTNAMSMENSQYSFKDVVKSGAFELNSNFRGKFSNQLLATITRIQTSRSTPGGDFPFIDIMGDPTKTGFASTYAGGSKQNYMSAGQENFSGANDVKNNIFNITNNFNYYLGKHTFTVGGAYEQQYIGNMFMPGYQSYYAFGSLEEFMTPGAHPIAYSYTFSRTAEDKVYSAELKFGQIGLYAQDEININPRLRLTLGLRFDKPLFLEDPLENPSITALKFPDQNGNLTNYSTGIWPKSVWYPSPRANVRWDVTGDKKLIFRAGTGIFTGRIPFVYLTNMPTNSGMYQVGVVANQTQLNQITFNPDRNAWKSLFSAPAPVPNSAGWVIIDPKYKFPSVWRTNIAFDKMLGKGYTLSVDAIYTKDLNATVMRNINESKPLGTVNLGGSTRPSFTNTSTATRRLYSTYGPVISLENEKGGGGFQFTTQVSKSFAKGFYASLAYTFNTAFDYTANPGSTASSTWQFNNTAGSQNDRVLSYSAFASPHRILGTFSYRKEYLKHLGTTLSVFYEGSQLQGGRFNYIYGSASGSAPTGFSNTGDVNYDGNTSDLMYVPRNASEITFTPQTVGSGANAITYTAQQQSDAFFAFVAQDKYLSKRMGQVAERNGAVFPFYHRVDARLLQDIFTNIGPRRNTLQFSIDCQNLLNLVNKDWGVRDFFVVNNPLRATKNATTGEVRYQLATYTPTGQTTARLVDRTFVKNVGLASTYSLQIGLRYIF